MASNDPVNDQEILNGFTSPDQAMVMGFDAMRSELSSGFSAIAKDISRLNGEILNV